MAVIEEGPGRVFVGPGDPRRLELGSDGITYLLIDEDGNITLENGATFPASGGDVTGPASAVDDRLATFNGVSGKIIKDGGSKISDLLSVVVAAATYQPVDGDLTAIAALASAANKVPYATGAQAWALADFTAAGRALVDDADALAQRTTLGLGTADSPQVAALNIGHASDTTLARSGAGDLSIEGNTLYRAGGTDVPVTDGGTGASTAATARTNLGVAAGAWSVEDPAPVNETRYFSLYAPFACTIDTLTHKLSSGTCTIAIAINGTPITGLSAVSVSSTKTHTNATAGNSVAAGDELTYVISSASTPVGLSLSIRYTR